MGAKNRAFEDWNLCEMEEFAKNYDPARRKRIDYADYPEFLKVWLQGDPKDEESSRLQSSFREFGEGTVENEAGYSLSWPKPFRTVLSTPGGRKISFRVDPVLDGRQNMLYFILKDDLKWDGARRRLTEEEIITVASMVEDAVRAFGYTAAFLCEGEPGDFDA